MSAPDGAKLGGLSRRRTENDAYIFMKACFYSFMKHEADGEGAGDEHLQIQVPTITKRDLGQRALDNREPIRMIVLRALQAYGVTVPPGAISDRRKRS